MTTGQTVAVVIGSVIVAATALIGVASSTKRTPKPGERHYGYRGKEFTIYPVANGAYELDIGDELHVGPGGGRRFVSTTQALKFAHKRIDSDQPPRFY